MKLMPLSMAVRMMRMASSSAMCLKPRCQPPRPINETFIPVRPSIRVGTGAFESDFSDIVPPLFADLLPVLNQFLCFLWFIVSTESNGRTGNVEITVCNLCSGCRERGNRGDEVCRGGLHRQCCDALRRNSFGGRYRQRHVDVA